MRATMGGVLIAVTLLLTSGSNAQPTPDTQPTPQTPLPTATPAAPNTAPPPSPSQQPPPSPSQQAKTTSSKMANVQRLHARPGRKGRRTQALGSYLEREARACIRRNIPMLYQSGGYGTAQAISFQEEMF